MLMEKLKMETALLSIKKKSFVNTQEAIIKFWYQMENH